MDINSITKIETKNLRETTPATTRASNVEAESQQSNENAQIAEESVKLAPSLAATKEVQTAAPEEEKAEATTREEAAKLAERLEETLQEVVGTTVKFSAEPGETGADAFSFQVIEKESGEVLREFPEDAVRDLVTREDISSSGGVLVDEAA